MMQMAHCQSCQKPTPLEELASDEMCTACCQRAYGLTGLDANWDAEAEKLFTRLNLGADQSTGKHNDLDAVWQHPRTGARVFIGNRRAASQKKTLQHHGIRAIVNCQDLESQNFFESSGDVRYLRFDVQAWPSAVPEEKNVEGTGTVEYFTPCFQWIDGALEQGDNVLIHCYAGAHRAGTVGTAFLMHASRLHLQEALRMAQHCRPIINPFARLLKLLHMLDRALTRERASEDTPREKGFDEKFHKPAYMLRVSS